MTFFAPDLICFFKYGPVKYLPVASITKSTLYSFHGINSILE